MNRPRRAIQILWAAAALWTASALLSPIRAEEAPSTAAESSPLASLCIRSDNHPEKWPDFAIGLQDGWSHLYGDFVPESIERFSPETDQAAAWTPWDWNNPTPNTNHATRLWLRGILPDVPYPDKSLLLANFQCDAFAVFLDGKPIYQSGSFSPEQWIPGRPYRRLHLISMPSDAAGKTLHLLLYATKSDRIPPVEPIVLFAAQSKLVHHLVASEWLNRSFGYLFFFVGLYGLLAYFVRRRYGIGFSPWFAFMSIFLGLSELCSGNVMFMLSERAEWLYQVNILSFLLFPIGLWRFIEQTFGPGWKKLVRRCWQIELALAIFLWPSDLFGWLPLAGPGKWIMYAGLGVQTLVGAGMALHGVIRGKGKERVVAIGLLVFAATGLVDIATVVIPFLPETEFYLWGALALVAAMAWLQERAGGEAHIRLRDQTQELQKHQLKLEELVDERTSELRLATQAAQAANRAKSEFLANMSHELRTPLNAVLGYAQLLRRDETSTGEQRERAAIIQQSGEHLLTVINDILDISKIEAGKLEIATAELRLLPLLKSIADMIAPRAQSRNIDFQVDFSPSLPDAVSTDEKRIRQILLNLLSNAVKFTERGSVRFTAARENAQLVFRVADTGLGIAPDNQEAIFEPFLQLPGQAQNEGTGLGLAISRRIARKMGGDILVRSTLGQGSEFTLRIPCAETPAPLLPSTPSSPSKAPFLAHGLLLVADDRPENRAILRAMLEPLGFEILEAENGRVALDLARSRTPDLILMDLLMPELDGFEAVRLLKADPALATIPVVAVSASVYDQTQAQSLCAGCEGFLPKPVSYDALLALVQSLLHLNTPAAPAPLSPPSAPCPSPLPPDFAPLRDAALIGDVLRVLAEAERLLPLHPAHAPFLAHVRHLADDFQIQALQRLLK